MDGGDKNLEDTMGHPRLPDRYTESTGRYSQYYGYGDYNSASKRDLSLRDYLQIGFNYKWMIVLCAVVGLMLGVLLKQKLLPVYESKALVNIGTHSLAMEDSSGDSDYYGPEYVNNLIALLNSYSIVRLVFNQHPELVQKIFGSQLTAGASSADRASSQEIPVWMLDHYLAHINFIQVEDTSLVEIKARASKAGLAASIANAHASAFIEMVRKQRFIAASTNVDFLQKRYAESLKSSKKTDTEMVAFAKEHSLPIGRDVFRSADSAQHSHLIGHLSDAVQSRMHTEGQLRQLKKASTSSVRSAAVSDKTLPIAARIAELEALKRDVKGDSRSRSYANNLQRQIEGLKGLLKVTARHELEQHKIKAKAARQKEVLLKDEIRQLKGEELDNYDVKLKFTLLTQESARLKEEVSDLKSRLDDAVISAESDRQTVTVIDAALAPAVALPEKRASSLFSGGLLGFLIGFVLALLFEMQNTSVRTYDDIRNLAQAPMLGSIPAFTDSHVKGKGTSKIPDVLAQAQQEDAGDFSSAIETLVVEGDTIEFGSPVSTGGKVPVVVRSPLARESESFRNIRTTLQFSSEENAPHVILVTSGQKGDGKTTLSTNLAASLAQSKRRTVLIDADLRLPSVSSYFGLDKDAQGLADYLSENTDGSFSPIATSVDNLWVIPAGKLVANPGELLCTPLLRELVEDLKKEFEYVIIDAPPVGDMSDALLLSQVVDGVMLVVRSGHSSKYVVKEACTKLEQVRANILGIALNEMPIPSAKNKRSQHSKA